MGAWAVAGFADEGPMVDAAARLQGEGFAIMEIFTPFPSPRAMRVLPGPTAIPLMVLGGGLGGIGAGFFLQWWANAFNFPIDVAGRPLFSVPTYVPICFECMVLLASFAGLYGMLVACRMPRLDHPFQDCEVFLRHTVDRYVLAVRWDVAAPAAPLLERLRALGASELAEVVDP